MTDDTEIPTIHPEGIFFAEFGTFSLHKSAYGPYVWITSKIRTPYGYVFLTLHGSGRSWWEPKLAKLVEDKGINWPWKEHRADVMLEFLNEYLKGISTFIKVAHREGYRTDLATTVYATAILTTPNIEVGEQDPKDSC